MLSSVGRDQLPSEEHMDRALVGRHGLSAFTRAGWHQVEPAPIQWSWHHDVLCDELARVDSGETRKLVICVPPGSTKTLLVSVFWPALMWARDPAKKVISTTYGGKLAVRSARHMRQLVQSQWYRARWPHVEIPRTASRAVSYYETSVGGFRFSGGVGGDVTGRHAHVLVGDDLNKSIDAYGASVAAFDASWALWSEVLPTRQADPARTAKVLIGQRLHRDDVPGRWMCEDPGVRRVVLPMRAYPLGHHDRHQLDPRAEGELLWPARYGEDEVAELEATLGPSISSAQLQQEPIPPGGQLLRQEYLSHRWSVLPSRVARALEQGRPGQGQTWRIYGDLTFKGKPTSDYVVFQLWCSAGGHHYLADQIRGQWGFMDTARHLSDFTRAHPVAQSVHLEDAANAPGIVDQLEGQLPIPVVLAPVAGGCLARTQQAEAAWASGSVVLPERATWMGGSDGFVAEHLAFDGLGTRHDDQVACSSLALVDLACSATSRWAEAWAKV